MDLLPCAACIIDEKGDILFANSRTSSVSGFSAESLTGTNIAKYGLTTADVQKLLEDPASPSLLKEMVTKELDAVHMNVSASRIPDSPYILLSFDAAPQYMQAVKEKAFFKSFNSVVHWFSD